MDAEGLELFHPAVKQWFLEELGEPTEAQRLGWRSIKEGKHTLIAAPTGQGKTLAAFLASIDGLTRQFCHENTIKDATTVLYLSPLKALSNDIEQNLDIPLKGIAQALQSMGLPAPPIRTAVRTGDTTPSQRAAMLKKPPHILVTTPESLYILLTSEKGRAILRTVRSVIVDEIHALVPDKRGSHLALSLERLEHLCDEPLLRIGLSATQKPIDKVAQFLVGEKRSCQIINAGHNRKRDLNIELPASPLEAVMSGEIWGEVYDRLTSLILEHHTTLVFVNTRRLAERMSRALSERLGEDQVTAHHGSLSKELRYDAEQRLKQGKLKALVATASLELGIDIGDIDLVCQIGSPRSISALLQRIGRSGHNLKGTPKGRLFPLSRDELVECAALLDAVRRQELDVLKIPQAPLDILAQQICAAVAAEEWSQDELFDVIKQSFSFCNLEKSTFDEVVTMLARGFSTRRGRRAALIHHDAVNRILRARPATRLTAMTCGGAIPDNADYDVVLEPTDTVVGTVNEDFAIESLPGNIFQLGNCSWQIVRIENSKLRVIDAAGQPPNIPFWFGEAPGRSKELSFAVSRLREQIEERLKAHPADGLSKALAFVQDEVGLEHSAARQLVDYLHSAMLALGTLPSQQAIVAERFFDEAGNQHFVIHSSFGDRINRAWGLALRKRFCRSFNFELQAAATDDAIILSLGPTHSFPLEDVFAFLKSQSVRQILIQAMLDAPMFETRWRWNASRALAVLRFRGGKKVPPQLQRIAAEDLIAVCFPDQLACLENIAGDREIPDHPLVQQTIHDCLTEAMDIEGLEALLEQVAQNKVQCIGRDLSEPSPLAQEILGARPYAFLDDTPLEERRTRAISSRRFIAPEDAASLGALDPSVIARVKEQAWPEARNADELHDALVLCAFWTSQEGQKVEEFFEALIKDKRATRVDRCGQELWVAAERMHHWRTLDPDLTLSPMITATEQESVDREQACKEIIRSRLEAMGPTDAQHLHELSGIALEQVEQALLALEAEGFAMRGSFEPNVAALQWCDRRLLARIQHGSIERLRKEIKPVSKADFMHFLLHWQHVCPGTGLQGPAGLSAIVEQLQGFSVAASAWENDVLPARLERYDPSWIDQLCLSGKIAWARLAPSKAANKTKQGPIRSTPMALCLRSNLQDWLSSPEQSETLSHEAKQLLQALQDHGANFFEQLLEITGLLSSQLENALSELSSLGLVHADSFSGLRALLLPQIKRDAATRKSKGTDFATSMQNAGRWSLIHRSQQETNNLAISQAKTLLLRYGIIFRALLARESNILPWRELLYALRRMEARGEIRGGRFVSGFSGEQYALPEAVVSLRKVKREAPSSGLISLSAADPVNLLGIVDHESRLTASAKNRILFKDGKVIAVSEHGEIRWLENIPEHMRWAFQNALLRVASARTLSKQAKLVFV
ncbi:MAG: DEAD/DEAH box helicase [Myxococcales bacterium]|nr:MAG: DEAD/DEAH box helicase [Myxococcales bacterium]